MSENKGVWVYSENEDLAIEMLSKGSELASKLQGQLVALLIGHDVTSRAHELISYGADKVIVADRPQLETFHIDAHLGIVTSLVKEHKPEILLIGSTKRGKELAARLATRLNAGCTPDCNKLTIDEQGRLVTERVVYGGNATAIQVFQTKPQIACVLPRTFEKPKPKDKKGEIMDANVSQLETPKIEIVEVKPIEVAGVKIEDAKIIIVGGRGIEKKEDFQILENLAQVLGGQCGYTRPLAEDRKWFKGNWVGLSGHKIKPELYIGCGNAGVIQHLAGIRDSKIIVAINKDSEAPLSEIADYIVVGNLYEIVPALTATLKKLLTSS